MSALELQKAIVTKLKADSAISALVGTRVYDIPPPSPTFPYISIGPDNTLPSRADCYDGKEIHQQIDVWSRQPNSREATQIIEAATSALNDAALSLPGFRLVDIYFERAQTLRDPDGLTSHGVLLIQALTEPE